jgi:simple sugar transport system permease protein
MINIKNIRHLGVLTSLLSILIALLAGAILVSLTYGVSPLKAYQIMFTSAFVQKATVGETINIASAIILTAFAFALPQKANFWNIGMEGQLYVGALFAGVVGYFINGLPSILHLFLMCLVGFGGGILAISVPAILKLRLGVNEILSTLLMNYIGMDLTFILLFGPLSAGGMPFSPLILPSARLPLIYGKAHSGILIVIAVALVLYFLYKKTVFGFELRSVGTNPDASRYSGIDPKLVTLKAALLGGGFAGLAGALQVSGVHYYFWEHISHGYGFFGIITAFLGKFDFFGIVLAGIFFGGIINGSKPMSALTGVSSELITLLLGVIILITVVMYSLESRLRRK